MATINGTPSNDTLTGTELADEIFGGAGNDDIRGNGGNDTLYGEDGNDTLYGGAGDDMLYGGIGDDILFSTGGGSDRLYGGAGNDRLVGSGLAQVFGEAGDDFLDLSVQNGVVSADGGDGNDTAVLGFETAFLSFTAASITLGEGNDLAWINDGFQNLVNLGTGDDRFIVTNGYGSIVTLGAGADEIAFGSAVDSFVRGNVTLNDYQPGIDRVTFDDWAEAGFRGWDGVTNPFVQGFLRLRQSGADAVLEFHVDANPNSWMDTIRFVGISINQLTAADLGGYNPNGSQPAGITLIGNDGNDISTVDAMRRATGGLFGTLGNDVIDGLLGNDQLFGNTGNDILRGGGGNDEINGGAGNDRIEGGEGDDTLVDDGGIDTIFGGGGNDRIILTQLSTGIATIDGGNGNDFLIIAQFQNGNANARFDANLGAGDDAVSWGFITSSGNRVDLGDGNDIVNLKAPAGLTVTLGPGADTVNLLSPYDLDKVITASTITDFTPGVDRITLPDRNIFFPGWNTATSLFAGGYLRLAQSGAGAMLLIDKNGGGNSFESLVFFDNVAASAFTAADFGGVAPNAIAPLMFNGTGNADVIIGSGGDDTVLAGAGNDRITGGLGNDSIDGGIGVDVAVFSGVRTEYQITRMGGTVTVQHSGGDGLDTITATERLQFADGIFSVVPQQLVIRLANNTLINWDATRGSEGFTPLISLAPGASVAGVADFTGDGTSDLLFKLGPGSFVLWNVALGGGGFTALNGFDGFEALGIGDMRGSAAVDVLAISSSRELRVFDVSTNSSSSLLTMAPGFSVVGVGNVDGVGKDDFVFINDATRALFALTDSGWRDLFVLSAGWQVAGIADVINGPADDLVMFNENSRTSIFWDPTQGGSGWRNFATIAPGWTFDGFSDLNGDARTDVLLKNTNGDAIYWTGAGWGSLGNVLSGVQLVGTGEFV